MRHAGADGDAPPIRVDDGDDERPGHGAGSTEDARNARQESPKIPPQ